MKSADAIRGLVIPANRRTAGAGGRLDGCDDDWYCWNDCRTPDEPICSCCCCCWRSASSSTQPHFSLSSLWRKPIRQPVSFLIFSNIWRTSSCSLRSMRHSAAIARDRRATLATPLMRVKRNSLRARGKITYRSLTWAAIPQIWCEWCICKSCISSASLDIRGLICDRRHMAVW